DNLYLQEFRWALDLVSYCANQINLYRVPTKVPYHPFNYRMAAAIFIRVVSRHGILTMRYWMKPLTAPPGGKRWC
ncbi:hypothetical protein AVEN_5014-1, partial [Araneus ventricosus]